MGFSREVSRVDLKNLPLLGFLSPSPHRLLASSLDLSSEALKLIQLSMFYARSPEEEPTA